MTIERSVVVECLGAESTLIGGTRSSSESNFFFCCLVGFLQLEGVLVTVTQLEVKVKLKVLLERLVTPKVALKQD
jgi:hypothetical protein